MHACVHTCSCAYTHVRTCASISIALNYNREWDFSALFKGPAWELRALYLAFSVINPFSFVFICGPMAARPRRHVTLFVAAGAGRAAQGPRRDSARATLSSDPPGLTPGGDTDPEPLPRPPSCLLLAVFTSVWLLFSFKSQREDEIKLITESLFKNCSTDNP